MTDHKRPSSGFYFFSSYQGSCNPSPEARYLPCGDNRTEHSKNLIKKPLPSLLKKRRIFILTNQKAYATVLVD